MPIKNWECGKDEDDYIGICYRVILFTKDDRRLAAVGLRGLKAARMKMMEIVANYTTARAEALGRKMVVGSRHRVKADIMEDGMSMRVNFREGPVNFLIEEDADDCDLKPWGDG